MKPALAIPLLTALAGQASAAFRLGVRNWEYYAAPETTSDTEDARIVLHGPDEYVPEEEKWDFQLPEVNPDTEVLIQHVQTEKYLQCTVGEPACVLADNGTSFTAYKSDADNGLFMIGADVGDEGEWVLEPGDYLHLASPDETVLSQWFSFTFDEE